MRHFSITVDIAAGPERVWEVMTDFKRWPEWTASVTSIEQLGEGEMGWRRAASRSAANAWSDARFYCPATISSRIRRTGALP